VIIVRSLELRKFVYVNMDTKALFLLFLFNSSISSYVVRGNQRMGW